MMTNSRKRQPEAIELFCRFLELGISSLNNLLLKESNRSWEIQVHVTLGTKEAYIIFLWCWDQPSGRRLYNNFLPSSSLSWVCLVFGEEFIRKEDSHIGAIKIKPVQRT
ncbi:CDC42 small effector protein 2 isoform X1 [Vidua macroura]|uniref:CDC42 small effector protein 2 isoform X1 n=1 Tax=Vidua chalybeata TaxID=81927 RepID=UPI0023A85983|nr:CDC42 small effector protein 2 isoform X1 [Vidua chalybeata]XP_053859545.1 CDC42 small effector protein 2 isoform X1 [Vidua macroura]